MKDKIIIPLQKESDVFDATDMALRMAADTGFARLDCNLIATAVSEIATNVIRYAKKGIVRIAMTDNRKGLSILVEDKGPGIDDPHKALEDGYTTTKTSLGVGMGAARRAMDYFSVRSGPRAGTRVSMKKYLPIPDAEIEYGIVSLPDDGHHLNGDGYVIHEFGGDRVLLSVIDGLGQGHNAYLSSMLVKEVIEANHHCALDNILYKCDTALKGKGELFGAAIGLMLIRPRSIQYAAVGDTFLQFLSGDRTRILSQRGLIGQFRMPVVKVVKMVCRQNNMVVVLCTDGIRDHFSAKDLPVDAQAQVIADHIMTNYRREFGDATVLVTKFNKTV
ncbi:MAG: ATP-binding protein [Bacteroidetes bacterium]|nr:ATP-binding protein [Bacteroidota bacterium]